MTLHVVSHRRWVADELASTGADVRHSLGLDLPAWGPGDAVWAPMDWMARARFVEPRLHLADPGPLFTPRLDEEFTRRRIDVLTHDEIKERAEAVTVNDGPDVFAKPANCKIEALPGVFDDYKGHVLGQIAARVLPGDPQLFHVTETRLDILEEHRLYVLDGAVVTSSPYLHHGRDGSQALWSDNMRAHPEVVAAAKAFGADVLASIDPGQLPPAFTLDVAFLANLAWAVIETNPAWSSAFYGADIDAVVACINASTRIDGTDFGVHEWVPDPWVATQAARQRHLS